MPYLFLLRQGFVFLLKLLHVVGQVVGSPRFIRQLLVELLDLGSSVQGQIKESATVEITTTYIYICLGAQSMKQGYSRFTLGKHLMFMEAGYVSIIMVVNG